MANALPPLPAKKTIALPAAAPVLGAVTAKRFATSDPVARGHFRIGLYGTGGCGKTSLAVRAPGPAVVIDLDDSIDVIRSTLPPDLPLKVVRDVESWTDLRGVLHQPDIWTGVKTIIIDTMSKAEELAGRHVVETIPTEKGAKAKALSDYSFGKDSAHVYDTMLLLFGDLDAHYREGRNIILVCHDAPTKAPNPAGEDFLRWEPRLLGSPKCNVRTKLKEWCDHLLWIGYDIKAADGKAKGGGSRCIWPQEQAHFMAKSRSLHNFIPYDSGSVAVWQAIYEGIPF